MIQASNYRIEQDGNCYSIFLDDLLFGTIEEDSSKVWFLTIRATAEYFSICKKRLVNSAYEIKDLVTDKEIGSIAVPLLFSFYSTVTFISVEDLKFNWVVHNFFSLHWEWQLSGTSIVEAIEDIVQKSNSGMLHVSTMHPKLPHFIILGIFLSIRRKQKLTLGLYNFTSKILHGYKAQKHIQ